MSRDSERPLDPGELLPEEREEELARALRAAFAPGELDAAVNEALIAAALEDPLAPPTEEEVAESARLRDALAGEGEHPALELARALSSAHTPRELTSASADRALSRALPSRGGPRRGNVIFVSFGAATLAAVAIAASWFLFVRPVLDSENRASLAQQAEDLAVSRSTASMFSEKFEPGATTARVDRIALARSRELRSNRYALWGVR
ncbi:MAG: hypothetical protein U0263_23680 [Polyangiaceae bacterium]